MSFEETLSTTANDIQRIATRKRAQELTAEESAKTGNENEPIEPGSAEWSKISASYDWIPELYARFMRPDPEDFTPLIGSMKKSVHQLSIPALHRMSTVQNHVSPWTGDAADTFDERFLAPFPGIVDNQELLGKILVGAMETNQRLFRVLRRNILEIAKATESGLEALGPSGGAPLKANLTVFSAIVGLSAAAAAAFTGGATLAAYLSIVAGGATLTAESLPEDDKADYVIGGDTVDGVLGNMLDTISRQEEWFDREERSIAKALQKNYAVITSAQHRSKIVAPRPTAADLPQSRIKSDVGFIPPGTS